MGISINSATNVAQEQVVKKQIESVSSPIGTTPKVLTLTDTFIKEKKKNGLIERLYDGIKNLTGLGIGSKKVKAEIAKAENGEISKDEAIKSIENYGKSQETSAQLTGDLVSIGASGITFAFLNKWINFGRGVLKTNTRVEKFLKEALKSEETPAAGKFIAKNSLKILDSKKNIMILSAIGASLVGGISKYFTMKFNRVGSSEFKIEKEKNKNTKSVLEKAILKEEKAELKKERKKANFRNFASGCINGAMTPLLSLGAIVATPLYLVGSSLNRFFIGSHREKDKSLTNYIQNLKNDSLAHATIALATAIPMIKKANYMKTYNINLDNTIAKLSKAKLTEPDYTGKSGYEQIQDILFNTKNIENIINSYKFTTDEQIQLLTKENIFAVKFKQISNDSSTLTRALRESCPVSRSLEDAQTIISKNFGPDYEVTKLLGVGTVAETYLVKIKNGKEVCIKMLKDGISREKILQDKEKFKNIINSCTGKTADEKDYLLKNLDDIANTILKEVDLKNEMEAAQNLVKHTKVANVVKPIEVKNNLYVMEKAEGISLSAFTELEHLRIEKKWAKIFGKDTAAIDEKIKIAKQKLPNNGNFELTEKEAKRLVIEYHKVLNEQFRKIEKNGKFIHADIHPGNIFINVDALKSGKGKVFTLIDTGNVIQQSSTQALHNLNLDQYVYYKNVPDIVDFALNGAVLPEKMSQKEAIEKVSKDLSECLFDDKTKLEILDQDTILNLVEQIMQKYKIIPNNTQAALKKAKTSAKNSEEALAQELNKIYREKIFDKDENLNKTELTKSIFKNIGRIIQERLYDKKQDILNLKELTFEQLKKQRHNPNNLQTNSENYLTAELKSLMYNMDAAM